jgi:flagellar biosynthetic protein FliP
MWAAVRRAGGRRALALLAILAVLCALTACVPSPAGQPGGDVAVPRISVEFDQAQGPRQVATGLQILLLLTVLSLAPALMVMVTSFTRIAIVLSFVRNAMGVPQLPPNQVLLGLALFLTMFVMAPTWMEINDRALQPYLQEQISQEEAFERAIRPLRAFMLKQTREKDLALFVHLAKIERPQTPDDVPTYVLVPAFIISELKTAFQMGFVIFVPFLIIDIVVSSVLMSMGMLMLPPVVISLPFKILLFVLVDGWHLIIRSLVMSFG